MIIDCSECQLYQTEHCKDCLVTAVLEHEGDQVSLDPVEQEAIEVLQRAGLAPVLKFQRKAG